jgi:hypothetical protein
VTLLLRRCRQYAAALFRAIASCPFGVVNAPYFAAESAALDGFLGSWAHG